jgi:hypothetical protein
LKGFNNGKKDIVGIVGLMRLSYMERPGVAGSVSGVFTAARHTSGRGKIARLVERSAGSTYGSLRAILLDN